MKTQRKILQLSYAILFLLALFVFSCKKEKPVVPETKNPCECAREVTADFTMEERSHASANAYFTNTDTIFKDKDVRFTALEEDAEYTWYIGIEELNTREVSRYFDQSLSGSNIPITLVVKKAPNKLCFPDDNGYDSTTKILHVSQYPIENGQDLILGSIEVSYRVKSDHLIDSFDLNLNVFKDMNQSWAFSIENYDGNGSNCICLPGGDCNNSTRVYVSNYRQIWTQNGPGPCNNLRGYIHNKLDGEVEMYFETSNPGDTGKIYLGRKL